MVDRIKAMIWIIVAAVAFLAVSGVSVAGSFPFREVELGDTVPDATLSDYKSQASVSFAGLRGHPFVALFWGADIEAKKRRSIEALQAFQLLRPFLRKREIPVLTINAQGDSSAVIDEVIGEAGGEFPVYIDSAQTLYGKLGIYVMPAFLLVGADGKVAAGMGYSHDLGEELRGEVEILLGEKSREQVELELHPVMVEKSAEEKEANRLRNMGFVMARRGMPESAIPEFEAVIKLFPDDAPSLIELGCLYVETGEVAKAEEFLDKGLELAPDSLHGQICEATLLDGLGKTQEAVEELQGLLLRNSRNSHLHYILGTLLEKMGQLEKAVVEYRKGYELLERKDMLHQE